jgi:hypothetical protein
MISKQKTRDHELSKAKMEYEQNDPERLYKRQVFGEKIKEVEFDSGIVMDPDNASLDQTFAFNQSREILNAMMPDGMELNNKGVGVYSGTETKIRMPQWRADELRAQINIAMAMESGKEAMVNQEISNLSNKLALSEAHRREGREPTGKDKIDKGRWGARLQYLQDKKNNPESYSKMLMDDNKSNMASLNVLYRMPTKNEKLITMLHNKIKLNNSMLGNLSKSGDLKDMVGHTFSRKNKDGSINKITNYYKKDTIVPNTYPGGYTRGSLGKVGDGSGTGKKSLTVPQQQTILKDYSKDERILATLKVKVNKDEAFSKLVAQGYASPAEAEQWKALTATANKDMREKIAKLQASRRKQFGNEDWAKDLMGNNTDPLGLGSRAKKKKSDYDGMKYKSNNKRYRDPR